MSFASGLASALRYGGDSLHVASKAVLITKIMKTKSCNGLSLKTQFLYTLVFLLRYIDILDVSFVGWLSIYNFVMKLLFIGFQSVILFLMRFRYFSTYDKKWDKFNILVLIIPCFLLAIPFARSAPYSYVVEFLYTASLFLESVAILPQLVQLQEAGESETMTSKYVLLLGLYRTFYTLYFVIKKLCGLRVGNVLIACGLVQTLLYVDFFVIYYRYVFRNAGESSGLPTSNIKREL